MPTGKIRQSACLMVSPLLARTRRGQPGFGVFEALPKNPYLGPMVKPKSR